MIRTRAFALEGDARVHEIARMLGGDPDPAASREHARELLRVGGRERPEAVRRQPATAH